MHELLLDTTSRTAVCLTAKVANSEISDYIRWTVLGTPRACTFSPSKVKRMNDVCDAYCAESDECHSRLVRPELEPLDTCTYYRFGYHTCPQLQAGWRMMVPLRDPYTKLLSAFHSKHNPCCSFPKYQCSSSDKCLHDHYLPEFSMDDTDGPAFIRYLRAIVGALNTSNKLNYHFWLQSEACLSAPMVKLASQRRVERIPVPIDRGGAGFDALSKALGVNDSERSFAAVMQGPYSFPTSCHRPDPWLLGALSRALAPSYAALRMEFGIEYETEAALARAAASHHSRICTTYGLFARNSTDEEWATLHTHSSGTTNLRDGNRSELCCEDEEGDSGSGDLV